MTAREQLLQEIAQAPEALVEEVLDFLIFIQARHSQQASSKHLITSEDQYEKVSRARGLLSEQKASLIAYANQVRQEWE